MSDGATGAVGQRWRVWAWLAGALAGVVLVSTAQAQPAAGLPGDRLPVLLQQASTEHPNVKAKQNELKAAGFDLDAARWGRYPSFGTELQTTRGRTQAVAKLEQPLWTGGRITGQMNLAAAGLEAATAGLDEARTQALLETASAFFELVRLNTRLDIARVNEAEHQRLQETIERRVAAEVSPMADQIQAGTRLRQAVNERMQIQRQRDNVRFQLEQQVGRPVVEVVSPARVRLGEWTEQQLVEAALEHAPQRKRLRAQIAAAQAEIEVARARLMPQLVVGYSANLGDVASGTRRSEIYLGLNVQTGSGLSGSSAVEAAVARKSALQDALDSFERQIVQQVQTTWSDAQALASQVAPVKALLGGSNEIVASYLRQFQVGRKNWLDVLNAQREKSQAHYTLADIESPLLLAHTQLLLLTGTLTLNNLDLLDD